jgi:hypothetical protein
MEYRIRFVDDALLEVAGQQLDSALCKERGDGFTLAIRRSARTMSDEDFEAVLEAGWQAYREMVEAQSSSATASP